MFNIEAISLYMQTQHHIYLWSLLFSLSLSLLFGWINIAFPVVLWAISFLVQIFVLFFFDSVSSYRALVSVNGRGP